jgi:steroid 5-alpha reductase family enzyme
MDWYFSIFLIIIDGIGLALWVVGFSMEAIADLQKVRWQGQLGEKRHTEFIHHGLWSLSRHPNYFGEGNVSFLNGKVVLWIGNYLMCASAFRNSGSLGLKAAGVLLLSPLFVTGLICGISGIPPLEAASDKKFGHLPEYQEYKAKTPAFFPKFTNLNEKELNKND